LNGNILVVDDDPNVVEIISKSLNREGYVIESAYDGEDALVKVELFDPDLIILDTILPKIDGVQVCSRILSNEKNCDIPIVMLSDDILSDLPMEAFKYGAREIIKKPFTVTEIVAKINNYFLDADAKKDIKERNEFLKMELQKGQSDYDSVSRELKRKILNLRTLSDLSLDLNKLQEPQETIHVLCLTFIGHLGISSVAIFNTEYLDARKLTFAGGMGVQENVLETLSFSRDSKLIEYLVANEGVVDLAAHNIPSEADEERKFLLNLGFKYCFLMVVKSNIVGIILVGEKINHQDYSENDLEMFIFLCQSAANGLANSRLYSELQNTYLSTINALISTIEAKDPYTNGHTKRVAKYANILAEEIGLSKKEQQTVSFGAALHDIGKLGVYENILNKSGELTEKEWKVIKSHPEIGDNIIKGMKFLESARDLVRHHHERLDGSGYPDGLEGEEISIGARIVAIADSFDAMTSDRPYRKALSFQEGINQLSKQTNKFDGKIIHQLINLVNSGRIHE
jgi:putative nucleotidyltransferase with HDIG domain